MKFQFARSALSIDRKRTPLLSLMPTLALTLACVAGAGCDLPASRPPPANTIPFALPASPLEKERRTTEEQRVTLAKLLEHAQTQAPEMLVADGSLALADAEVAAARQVQPTNPTISLALGQRRQAGGAGLDAQVAVEQQIELAGQRRKRREAARRYESLTRLGVDVTDREVHVRVHRGFEQALLAEARRALAVRVVEFDKELLSMAERRVEVGAESPFVLELARARLILSENAVTAATARVEIARFALARVSGWQGELKPLGSLDRPQTIDDNTNLLRSAVKDSPVLQRAQARIDLARARVDVARREAWPSPSIGVSYSHEGSTSTPGNSNPASDIWMGTVSIPIPTFARNQGAIARQRSALKLEEARGRAAWVQFESTVATAVAQLNSAATRVNALEREVVPAFERSLTALRRAYEVGELEFFKVAQAREQLWTARREALIVREEYYDAFAEVERWVGPLTVRGVAEKGANDETN